MVFMLFYLLWTYFATSIDFEESVQESRFLFTIYVSNWSDVVIGIGSKADCVYDGPSLSREKEKYLVLLYYPFYRIFHYYFGG